MTKSCDPPSFEFYLLGNKELARLSVDISIILIPVILPQLTKDLWDPVRCHRDYITVRWKLKRNSRQKPVMLISSPAENFIKVINSIVYIYLAKKNYARTLIRRTQNLKPNFKFVVKYPIALYLVVCVLWLLSELWRSKSLHYSSLRLRQQTGNHQLFLESLFYDLSSSSCIVIWAVFELHYCTQRSHPVDIK